MHHYFCIVIFLTVVVLMPPNHFLRASPVNSLQRAITFTEPTEPLEFRDSLKKKPKKKNLKKSRLLRKMGADFNADWMAIEKPAVTDLVAVRIVFQDIF